jgi:hypothetical protein
MYNMLVEITVQYYSFKFNNFNILILLLKIYLFLIVCVIVMELSTPSIAQSDMQSTLNFKVIYLACKLLQFETADLIMKEQEQTVNTAAEPCILFVSSTACRYKYCVQVLRK